MKLSNCVVCYRQNSNSAADIFQSALTIGVMGVAYWVFIVWGRTMRERSEIISKITWVYLT